MATLDEQVAERREEAGAGGQRRKTPKHPDPVAIDAEELLTPSGKRIKVTDQEFAVMLERAGGFRTRVAKQLGVTVSAITHRIKRSKYLTEVCRGVDETVLDLAEAQLIKAAQNGESWAITFILKCKGRKRGWIERQDFSFGGDPDALPPPVVIGVHDAAFIDAERARQEREFAELAAAAVIELKPESAPYGEESGETWAATGEPSGVGKGEWESVAPTGGQSGVWTDGFGAEPSVTGTGAAQDAPGGADASSQGVGDGTHTGAGIAPAADAKEARVPRSPSEAAKMRREQEARERGSEAARQDARPYRAVPVTFPRR